MEGDRLDPDVERLLSRFSEGEAEAHDRLLRMLYDQLHSMAHRLMADQRGAHTLQTTALLHEAWIRLAGPEAGPYQSHQHFVRVAARAMRSVLIDHARRRNAKKRSHGKREPLFEDETADGLGAEIDLLALDEALSRLAERDEELQRLVELRFFGGLTSAQAGAVLGLTERQVGRRWTFARGWLRRELEKGGRDD